MNARIIGSTSSKRSLTIVGCAALLLVIFALALAACGGDDGAATTDTGGAPVAGGTLTVGCQPPANLDPHFAALAPEEWINHQVYDWMVVLDNQNQPQPSIATEWEMSEDGTTWTFTIRDDVKFSDGTPMTAEDVAYSFNRMRDPDIGAPTASVYGGITNVEATDDTTVVFTTKDANPELVKDLADYHAAIISQDVQDPGKEWLGTGPFMVEKYTPEDRMVLVKNPNYWGTAEDGTQLPYLDGITFVFSPDEGSLAQALQGGEVDYVAGLSAELAEQVKANPELEVVTTPSNFHLLVHIRSDKGHPGEDPRLGKALRMGTDYQGLIDIVRPGLGTVGNGTIVGPVYGDYYWDQDPVYDAEGAKQLLAEAGLDGFEMTLYAQQYGDVQAFATAWKEQMSKIGVTVNIETVPADVYYSDTGDASWLKCDFGITNWADRATPVAYFNLAYVSDGLYNESHWSDPEFDDLTAQINKELDETKLAEMYQAAQQILWERGPVLVFGHEDAVAGKNKKVQGDELAIDWAKTLFVNTHITQ